MRHVPTKEQMKDPFVVAWVLRNLESARDVDDEPRVAELEALFDEEIIRDVLGADYTLRLSSMLRAVSVDRLRPLREELLAGWQSWPGTVAMDCAGLMATLHPGSFHELLASLLGRPETGEKLYRMEAILEGIAALGEAAHDLLRPAVKATRDVKYSLNLLPLTVQAALCTGDQRMAVDLLADHWDDDPDTIRVLDRALSAAYKVLTSAAPYYRFFCEVYRDETDLLLTEVPELFEQGAPLEELDHFTEVDTILELLPRGSGAPPVAPFARELARELPDVSIDSPVEDLLSAFVLGAAAVSFARKRFDLAQWDPRTMERLAAADLSPHPCLEAVAEAVGRLSPAQQVHLLTRADQLAEGHGERNVARLMGRAAQPELVQSLIHYLDRDEGDSLCEEATRALCRLGAAAEEGILACWEVLEPSQQIYGVEVLEYVGGEATIVHLLRTFPGLKADAMELDRWCRTAEALVDLRILDALEPELKHGHPAVEEACVTLCALLDRELPGLDQRRRNRERAEALSMEAMKALSRGDLFPLTHDHISMHLTCPDCGETNPYEVHEVYLSPVDLEAGPYIGDDLTCRSCGGKGPLEPGGPITNIGLMAEMMRYKEATDSGEPYDGPLKLGITKMTDGRELAPSAAVREYRGRLAANPESVPDLLGLGNLYKYLGPRRRSEECFERSMELDPAAPEAARSLAQIRFEAGDEEGAFRLLQRAVAQRHHWRFHRLMEGATPADFRADFVSMYNDLAEHLGQETLPAAPPGPASRRLFFQDPLRPEPIRRDPKVGRNDPCPCGSGKKYKKCCLRRKGV